MNFYETFKKNMFKIDPRKWVIVEDKNSDKVNNTCNTFSCVTSEALDSIKTQIKLKAEEFSLKYIKNRLEKKMNNIKYETPYIKQEMLKTLKLADTLEKMDILEKFIDEFSEHISACDSATIKMIFSGHLDLEETLERKRKEIREIQTQKTLWENSKNSAEKDIKDAIEKMFS